MATGKPYHSPSLRSLSARLLLLTVAFIMLGEVLIYAPSIARFRRDYLIEHIVAGELAALALEAAPERTVSRTLEDELLARAEVRGVVLHKPGQRVLALSRDMPAAIDLTINVGEENYFDRISGAFDTLFEPHRRMLRVLAASPFDRQVMVEVLIEERPMQKALWLYSERILALSIVLSLTVAGLLYFSLHRLIIRPMRRIAESIAAFRAAPENPGPPMSSTRSDEIGVAQRELAVMQDEIRHALAQKSRLAALGAAVAKINHDLRNTLATAALASDRLSMIEDPVVKQLTPRLVESIDKAVHICGQTLDYVSGRGVRQHRARFRLADLCAELEAALLPLTPADDAPPRRWTLEFPPDFALIADRDQLGRALGNLARNAFEAGAHVLRIAAVAEHGRVHVDIADDGPGLPERALENLFKPFAGSSRRGGTGLGLVIAHDMARAHGGDLALLESGPQGTVFRLTLPIAEDP